MHRTPTKPAKITEPWVPTVRREPPESNFIVFDWHERATSPILLVFDWHVRATRSHKLRRMKTPCETGCHVNEAELGEKPVYPDTTFTSK
jgi:hypothetical protein